MHGFRCLYGLGALLARMGFCPWWLGASGLLQNARVGLLDKVPLFIMMATVALTIIVLDNALNTCLAEPIDEEPDAAGSVSWQRLHAAVHTIRAGLVLYSCVLLRSEVGPGPFSVPFCDWDRFLGI